MDFLIDFLADENLNDSSSDKWELLMKHSDGCVTEKLLDSFSETLHKQPREVLMSFYNHRMNPPIELIDVIKSFSHELGENIAGSLSLGYLRQEIVNLPDKNAQNYLIRLFDIPIQ